MGAFGIPFFKKGNFCKYWNELNIGSHRPFKKEFKRYIEEKIGVKVIKSSTIKILLLVQ